MTIYSFNNQIRFNPSGLYNLPVGKRDFNSSTRRNIKMFSERIKKINFLSNDFNEIDYIKIDNPFFYCDPPYLLGDASYNENGGWWEQKELELLKYLKSLDDNGIKFALSNVIEHKGKQNKILLDWCMTNRLNIIYLDKSYSNSNYHLKNKEKNSRSIYY